MRRGGLSAYGLVTLGLFDALCVGGGLVAGVAADNRFHSSPALTLVGLGVGVLCGGVGTIMEIRKYL